jgi:hypothetical protein
MSKYKINFRKKIQQIRNCNVGHYAKLANHFRGRVLEKDNKLYLIEGIDLFDNEAKILQLFDSNGIKVNIKLYASKGNFYKISLKGLAENNFTIYPYEKSELIKTQFNTDTSQELKIWFSMRESNSVLGQDGFVYSRMRGKVFTPEKATPEGVDLSQYDIVNDGNQIIEVKNKIDGYRVVFSYEEIKSEFDSLPVTLQVYYSYFKKTLNILHLHSLDDTLLLSKGYEAVHLDRHENTESHKDTENLKLIFKNYRLNRVFKKSEKNEIKEIKFEEFNFKPERIVKIKSENSYLNGFYAKVKKLPVYQLAQLEGQDSIMTEVNDTQPEYETNDLCLKENNSEHLTGIIDLAVCFDHDGNYIDEIKISLPVCMLEFLLPNLEMKLEQKYLKEYGKRNSQELQNLEKICNEVAEYEKYLHSNNAEEIPDNLAGIINEYKLTISQIMRYIETNELWSYLHVIFKFNI